MEDRFNSNLARIRSVIGRYETVAGVMQGRPTVEESDLLRAAVVFLHATLEDLLRSLAQQRLASAKPEILKQIPWPRSGKTTFDLGDLAVFRGRTVDDAIQDAVTRYLERSSYNNPGQVKHLIEAIGLDPALVTAYVDDLGAMMDRRHWIVHRGDRNDLFGQGRGQHPVRSISKAQVQKWLTTVESFGKTILSAANVV